MKENIGKYIEGKEQEMINSLEEMVNIDSGSYDKKGVERIASIMAKRLKAIGFDVQVLYQENLGPHVVARKKGNGGKKIFLVGHMDTVFEEGTAKKRPFRIEGSRAYGPGVADMKAGLITMVYALESLEKESWDQFGEICVIANSDEEIGSPTSEELIEKEGKEADMAFVLEPGRADGSIVSARKGVGSFDMVISGKAAHAGVEPEKGASAIEELAHKILALHDLTDLQTGTTVNVGVIKGGTRSNVVAESAYAKVDLRVPTKQEEGRMQKAIENIAQKAHVSGTNTRVIGGLSRPPMTKEENTKELVETVMDAARQAGFDVKDTTTGGGSDGNFIAALGTPVADAMGPVGGLGHSDQEYLQWDTMVPRCKMLAFSLLLCGEKSENR